MMPDVSLLAAVAGAAVLAGSAIQAATGFGFGLVAAPILFASAGPEPAIGLLMVLGLEVNLLTLAGERRRPQPLRADVAGLLLWALPGTLAGVAVLRALDAATLQIVVTIGVVSSLVIRRMRPSRGAPPRWAIPVTGLAAGALNTATSTSGPPLVLYLLRRRALPAEARDTLTVIFICFSFAGAAALLVTGTTEAIPDPVVLAALVPVVYVGHLAGRRGFARLQKGRYELALQLVLVAAAIGGLLTVLL